MVSSKNYGFLIVLYFVYLFQPSHTIQVCPEMAVLERYSTTKCSNRRIYHCLVEDNNGLNNYREECRTPEWVSIGHYPVFRGKYIDHETCPADSYQPFVFRSNEHYKCAYLKSTCSSEGLVDVTGGNKTIDRACRCDYNKGFAFVSRPINQCACIPSKDDCSCYIKRCSEGETLNPDYQCTLNNPVIPGNSSCPVLMFVATPDINTDTTFNSTVFNNLVTPKSVLGRIVLVIPVVIVILSLSIVITYLICLSKEGEKENTPLQETEKRMSARNGIAENTPLQAKDKRMSATNGIAENSPLQEKDKRMSATNGIAENSPLQEKDKRMSATNGIAENTPLQEKDKRMSATKEIAEDQHSKVEENSVLTPMENADIVILHTKDEEKIQEMADFKSKLEGISYCGVRYRLFEELFPTEQYNRGIEIQTLLRKCNFIFVYISKDFFSSKLTRYGLKESSISDALKANETKTKIKKLSDCEPWNMPPDNQLSCPDFDLYNFDYRSEDSIRKYHNFLEDILSNV